jgi:hypothetical protein
VTSLPLLDEDDLAVLDDDEGAWPPGQTLLDDAGRAELCRELITDHRVDVALAGVLSGSLTAGPAVEPWPDAAGVVALAECVARRFALDRSAALCLAVAVTRRLRRQGLRPIGLGDSGGA